MRGGDIPHVPIKKFMGASGWGAKVEVGGGGWNKTERTVLVSGERERLTIEG